MSASNGLGGSVGKWSAGVLAFLIAVPSLLSAPATKYGSVPLSFEENLGQAPASVKYLSRGSGYSLLLNSEGATLSLLRKDSQAAIKMNFEGSQNPELSATSPLPGFSDYIYGSDPSKWVRNSQHFGKVTYQQIYRGIDAVFYGNQRQLEYDFVVAPGADPKAIRLSFDGVERVSLSDAGDLVLTTAVGDIEQKAPVVYQTVNGKRRIVRGSYRLADGKVSFALARYDRSLPLVIDPVLLFSSFLGGTQDEEVRGIAIDGSNQAVIVGRTGSTDFALLQPTQSRGSGDAFVIKLNANGNSVVRATYLGGSDDDGATAVALDSAGNVYVGGYTRSGTGTGKFPINNAYQADFGGVQDAFVVKFAANSNAILFSTFLGGFQREEARGIALDAEGNVYVGGLTASTNFNHANGIQAIFRGGDTDGFLAKFTTDGLLAYSTYIGGEASDIVNGVAVDPAGNAYVTGETKSTIFPTTTGAFSTRVNGCNSTQFICSQFFDGFVAKFVPAGNQLVYSTFLGGATNDKGFSIAIDPEGNAYVAGETDSANFPVLNAFQPAYAGNVDGFVAKLNPAGSARVYGSFIGGGGEDRARSIAIDSQRSASVVGWTNSTNFPVINFVSGTNKGIVDGFLVTVNPAGTQRTLSTYLGGSGSDYASALAVDGSGNAYIGGQTQSLDFAVLNPVQASFAGATDGFIAKLSNCTLGILPTALTVGPGTLTSVITITGAADCPWTVSTTDNWLVINGATSGTGPGFVGFTVQANAGVPRVGTISVAGQLLTVTQEGTPITGCVYAPNPQNVIIGPQGSASTFLIQTSTTGCTWTTSSTARWLQAFPQTGTGQANIQYTAFPNFSTAVRTADILINGQIFRVTQAATQLNANQRFVTLVYFNFLGRYPSFEEIAFQEAQLAGGLSRADFVMSFYNAAEFNSGGRFVAGLYYGILRRDPEFGGWQFQRNALASGQVSQVQLVSNFLGSPEFALLYGNPANDEFVRILYRNILGREASADEVAFQVSNIPTFGRTQIAVNFLNSNEFRTRIDARLTSFLLYATLLGRDGSSAELNLRQNQISTGVPVRTLVLDIIQSPEFLIQII